MKRKQRKQSLPVPELIGEGVWNIKQTGPSEGYVQFGNQEMGIPLGDTDEERGVRAHEQAHAAITPRETKAIKGVHPAIQNNVEDARVNSWLLRQGINYLHDSPPFTVEEVTKRCGDSVPSALSALAASKGHGPEIRDAIDNRVREIVPSVFIDEANEALYRVTEEGATYKDTIAVAEQIQDICGRYEEEEEAREFVESPEGEEALADSDGNIPRPLEPDYRRTEEGAWGRVTFENPALTRKLPAKLRARVRRYSDEGVIPTAFHREEIDGAIYSVKRKQSAGSILIDASGSMALTSEMIEAIVAACPGVIIAAYCGEGASSSRAYNPLRVIARKGRLVAPSEINPAPGGNEIDGPALDWLAEQPEPRFWISDGYVCSVLGVSRSMTVALIRCVEKNRITRIESVPDWIEGHIGKSEANEVLPEEYE